ncbi:cell wall binding repeat-containing protein [Clostridium sp. DL-VIII]|uniref:N-acetylmuramoyl-L-alanine amidase family protein n=1 Tax=Clostridium sp. DL-VIII TaxID=641107 RepID=UPI00023B06BF|nr:cadherin-like beta sandwich domain-containing protein [Clostridium sp. DL-VIII]EHJ02089.1 cell wall binding repeat-containing protein [Clostridium sp. DL-VIII]
MRKVKSKFIALLMVFTSIVSFLPVQFGGQVAEAATTSGIRVNVTNEKYIQPTTSGTDVIYSHPSVISEDQSGTTGFDLTVPKVYRTDTTQMENEVKNAATTKPTNATFIVGQRVVIKAIDAQSITDTIDSGSPTKISTNMGIDVTRIDGTDDTNGEDVVGKRLVGLPYGVNTVSYEIIQTTQTVTYTPELNADGTPTGNGTITWGDTKDSTNISDKTITIEYGTSFAIQKIQSLIFKSYVGGKSDFDGDTVLVPKNNQKPFLYTQIAEADPNIPLRYNFNVPDSTYMLKYVMNFNISLEDAIVFLNGQEDKSIEFGDESLQGSLSNLGSSSIVIRIKSTESGDSTPITRSYALQIKYSALDASKDYSLKDAGITKQYMNDDSDVDAYIGKTFSVTRDPNSGFPIYNGTITIDSRAKQISLDPTLIVPKSGLGYSVQNNYKETADGTTKEIKASLSGGDGKNYVDFQKGAYSNKIQLDVYKGSDGNITDSSTILARYSLDVIIETGSHSTMNLQFAGSPEPYLRQPGVSDSVLTFNPSRVTYDLCFGNVNLDKVADPVTIKYTGEQSDRNEYIRVFYATNKDSNSYTEFDESKNNNYDSDEDSSTFLKRNPSITINLKNYEKIYIQTYYDKFDDKEVTDSSGNKTTQKVLVGSYPAGDKYVFYLPQNYKPSDGTPPEQNSNDASLSSLSVKGYTLKDADGSEGFSSDKLSYTTTVSKSDTSEKITVKPTNENVSSIVATINGSNDSYDLVSGEETELPLNSNGTTTVKILVTAQDGITTETYSVVIKNNQKSSNAGLKNVILNTGDYDFNPKKDPTEVRVDQNVASVQVTPIPEDSKSKVTVNGEDYSDSAISVSLRGSQKTEIEIVVESEDGSESKTYTLKVYRVDVSDWNGGSGDGSQYDDDQYYDDYNDCWVDTRKYDEWGTVNGKPTYFDKNHRQVKNAWIKTGGKLYYLNNVGYRASGWKVDEADGKTYYLDSSTGEMRTGWINLNNSWYYLELNGVMHKGWLYLNGKWYYFTPNGQMVVNQTMFVDDKNYTFGQDGTVIA